MNFFWFCTSNILAIAISVGAASVTVGVDSLPKFILATMAGYALVAVGAVLLTGACGLLLIQWVVFLLLVVALCGWLVPAVRTRIIRHCHSIISVQRNESGSPEPVMRELALILTVAFVSVPLVRCLVLGTNFGSDDLSYHGPVVAEWIMRQGIVNAPFDYHAYYPFNAEALAAWFVLPSHNDGFVGLAGAYWLILLWFAAVSLVMALGRSRSTGAIAAALIIAAPLVDSMANRISAPDIAGVTMVLAAAVFLAPDHRRTSGITTGSAIFAGLLLGFALGCKVSYGMALLVVICWILFYPNVVPTAPGRLRIAFIILATSLVTGGGWYVRNWLMTGSPVFPAQVGPFQGPFTSTDQARTKLITWILDRPTDFAQWSLLLRRLSDWPPSLFAVSVLGFLGSAWFFVRSRRGRGLAPLHALLFFLGVFLSVMFFFLPFSATYNEPHGSLEPAIRYAILPFAIGLICFCSLPWGTDGSKGSFMALVLLAIIPAWNSSPWIGLLLVPLAFMIVHINRFVDYVMKMTVRERTMWLSGGVVGVLTGLMLIQPLAQYLTDQRVYKHGMPGQDLGQAWKAIDKLPPGSKIAWFGNKLHDYYPLYGRGFNKTPVPLAPDGNPHVRLDLLYVQQRGSLPWWGDEPALNPATFCENIRRAGIDFILVSKWGGESWPAQQEVLGGSTWGTMIYNDGFSAIWRASSAQTKPELH